MHQKTVALTKTVELTSGLFGQLDRAESLDALACILEDAVRPLGVESTFAGVIPIPGTRPRDQAGHVLLDRTPSGWSERYFRAGHLFRDPVIHRLTTELTPFRWAELEPRWRGDAAAQRVMGEASEFRLRDGFTIPLVTLDGRVAGFSFGGDRLGLAPDTRGMLQLLASYAFGRSLNLSERSRTPAVRLTPRELEALKWAADGKTEWEIGEMMAISEHGAEKHLRAVRLKLGAVSRTHAVAEALRRRLIT